MELPDYTISELQAAFDKGERTSVGLCQAFLNRISKIEDPVRASSLPFFGELELELFRYGLKASLNRYLAARPSRSARACQAAVAAADIE